MRWKASSVMEEKARFVLEYEQDVYTMTELCHRYGIARETGYVWLRRYQQTGLEGLRERPRAPHQSAHQTPAKIEKAVLELRQAHMRWGPRKVKRVLERDQPEGTWPAASPIGAILERGGLVGAGRKQADTATFREAPAQ